MIYYLDIITNKRCEFVDITSRVQDLIDKSGIKSGIAFIYSTHTTAGITINENADPDVASDILSSLSKKFPKIDDYDHIEGNSDAHIKTSLFGLSVSVPIDDKRLILGTWQGIYLAEFDGPRNRKAAVKIIKG